MVKKRKKIEFYLSIWIIAIILILFLIFFSFAYFLIPQEKISAGNLGMLNSLLGSKKSVNIPSQSPLKSSDNGTLLAIPYSKGEIIVKFKSKVVNDNLKINSQSINSLNKKYNLISIESIADSKKTKKTAEKIAKKQISKDLKDKTEKIKNGFERTYLLVFPNDVNIEEIIKEYRNDPSVEYAEFNYVFHASESFPDDPYFYSSGSWNQSYDDLWNLRKINADKAWNLSLGKNIIVAVIDTGVDYNNPEISANIWKNYDEIPGNNIDDDHNGYIDDYKGYNFAKSCFWGSCSSDSNPIDEYGHGTFCAGTIAAAGNNNLGIIGIAPNSTIMNIRGLDKYGSGTLSGLAKAVIYAVDNGADVISASWGGPSSSQTLTDAFDYAWQNGVVSIAAAGNENSDVSTSSPANIGSVIAVASVSNIDKRSYFSNYGNKIEVSAPGNAEYSWQIINNNQESGETPEDSFLISTCEELQNMKNNLSGNYVLTNDIDCSATNPIDPNNAASIWSDGKGFKPIINVSTLFNGTLNGKGFSILNLYGHGLFSQFSGNITNVHLKNVNISGGGAIADNNYGNIINCSSSGSVNTGTKYAPSPGIVGYCAVTPVGGTMIATSIVLNTLIIGAGGGTTIAPYLPNSYWTNGSAVNYDIGGLVGFNSGNIINSFTEGSVRGTIQVGGIAGTSNGNISNCYSAADVYGTYSIGGIAGFSVSKSPAHSQGIFNSYFSGSVNGINSIGGLVGNGGGAISIVNSFSTGNVSGISYVGALAGYIGSGVCNSTISNSYWNNKSQGLNCSNGATIGCTAIQNNVSYFYSSSNSPMNLWDTSIWNFSGNSFPMLKRYSTVFNNITFARDSSKYARVSFFYNSTTAPYTMTFYTNFGPLNDDIDYWVYQVHWDSSIDRYLIDNVAANGTILAKNSTISYHVPTNITIPNSGKIILGMRKHGINNNYLDIDSILVKGDVYEENQFYGLNDFDNVGILSLHANGTDMYNASLSNPAYYYPTYSPGLMIVPEYNQNSILYRAQGTSMACPHVSAVAALIMSYYPGATNNFVRNAIKYSSDNIDSINPGYEGKLGAGRLNAYKALAISVPSIDSPADGSVINDTISIIGSAYGNDFNEYQLFYYPEGNITAKQQIDIIKTTPVFNNLLGKWNVSLIKDGSYVVRLELKTSDGAIRADEKRVLVNVVNSSIILTKENIPLNGTNVDVKYSNGTLIKTIVTDSNGKASLVLIGGAKIKFSMKYNNIISESDEQITPVNYKMNLVQNEYHVKLDGKGVSNVYSYIYKNKTNMGTIFTNSSGDYNFYIENGTLITLSPISYGTISQSMDKQSPGNFTFDFFTSNISTFMNDTPLSNINIYMTNSSGSYISSGNTNVNGIWSIKSKEGLNLTFRVTNYYGMQTSKSMITYGNLIFNLPYPCVVKVLLSNGSVPSGVVYGYRQGYSTLTSSIDKNGTAYFAFPDNSLVYFKALLSTGQIKMSETNLTPFNTTFIFPV